MYDYNTLVYGSDRVNRRKATPRKDSEEVAELGRTAVKGVVAVGTIAVTGSVLSSMLGAIQK